MKRDPVLPGQESVWDYPRPAIAQATDAHLRIVFAGRTLAETRRAVRTLETSHPPTYYIPQSDIDMTLLRRSGGRTSLCEWKGAAQYYDIVAPERTALRAAWSYATPTPAFAAIRDHIAVYLALMDACFVDGEPVTPQAGAFYGGWITSKLAGPFKGPPGTQFW